MSVDFKKLFFVLFIILFILSGCKHSHFDRLMRTELNNGMVIYSQKFDNLPVVAISVWARVGSAYEEDGEYGISHFLEHMLFRRKPTAEEQATIQAKIEGAGGYLNGATGKEITYYFAVVPSDFAEEALNLLLNLFLCPNFDDNDFAEEKKVIIEEISRKDDNPNDLLGDLLFETMYDSGHPYGHPVLGNVETIKNMKLDSLINYHRRYYYPGNMVVSIVGDFDKNKVVKDFKKRFSQGDKTSPETPDETKTKEGVKQKEVEKNIKQTYFTLAFAGSSVDDEEHLALDVLATILGEGASSRLVDRLKEKEKLVNEVGCHFFTQKLSGPFAIFAQLSPENLEKVKAVIWEELERIKNEPIESNELEKAKIIIESNFYFHHEVFKDQALAHAYWECLGVPDYEKNYLDKIEAVNAEKLREVALKYFNRQHFTQVVIKPSS